MRGKYYYVRWGVVLRVAGPCDGVVAACKEAFGVAATNMRVLCVGGRSPAYFSEKKRRRLREQAEGWVSPEREVR